MFFQWKSLTLSLMQKRDQSRRDLVLLMLILWQWLRIFNLKGFAEEEAEIIIKEAVVLEVSMVVIIILVLTISMVSMVGMSLSLVNLIRLELQVFRGNQVKIKDHSAKFVERMAIQLLTAIIG